MCVCTYVTCTSQTSGVNRYRRDGFPRIKRVLRIHRRHMSLSCLSPFRKEEDEEEEEENDDGSEKSINRSFPPAVLRD